MSEEQLAALLAKLQGDVELQENLKSAGGLDGAVEVAKKAGFDLCKEDLLGFKALAQEQTIELSDDQLETVSAGVAPLVIAGGIALFNALIWGGAVAADSCSDDGGGLC
jgi:predicted ribosomally synthesized peptide with nif11-like leader